MWTLFIIIVEEVLFHLSFLLNLLFLWRLLILSKHIVLLIRNHWLTHLLWCHVIEVTEITFLLVFIFLLFISYLSICDLLMVLLLFLDLTLLLLIVWYHGVVYFLWSHIVKIREVAFFLRLIMFKLLFLILSLWLMICGLLELTMMLLL